MSRKLMKGNEAIAIGAILGGCDAFFGYPITPQNEITEFLSKYMQEHNKVFVQAESEISAINMVYGASAAGARVMTSSSGPGIALKQEGISYLCGAELPCVIVSVMRGGPGLGGIQPSQSDYYQITRGGGNGDYRVLSYVPENVQEAVDIIKEAFSIADFYRNPVIIAIDGLIGQMMEPVDLDKEIKERPIKPKTWATTGKGEGGKNRIVTSLYLNPDHLYQHNIKLQEKYKIIKENESRYEVINPNSEYMIVAYGTMARICRSVIESLNEKGISIGMIRPITAWPFPEEPFKNIGENVKAFITCELSMGQMIDDVKMNNYKNLSIYFFGRSGGIVPEPIEIEEYILSVIGDK